MWAVYKYNLIDMPPIPTGLAAAGLAAAGHAGGGAAAQYWGVRGQIQSPKGSIYAMAKFLHILKNQAREQGINPKSLYAREFDPRRLPAKGAANWTAAVLPDPTLGKNLTQDQKMATLAKHFSAAFNAGNFTDLMEKGAGYPGDPSAQGRLAETALKAIKDAGICD